MRWKSTLKAIVGILVIGWGLVFPKVWAEDLTPINLGAKQVSEESLEDLRGGYRGFYFEVIFTGFWDTMGRRWADIQVKGGLGGDSPVDTVRVASPVADTSSTADSPEGDLSGQDISSGDPPKDSPAPAVSPNSQVKTLAVIGDFRGGNGIFQINQVPGAENIVRNGLVINIAIFDQPDTATQALKTLFGMGPEF